MKKKIIASVLFVLAIVMFGAFGMSCKKNNQVDYSAVNGVYSCVTPNGEYSLTITDNNFVLKTDVEEVGILTFDSDKWLFKFGTDAEKVEANFGNNMLTFTYKGTTYTLYKEVKFTVSFVADGKTTKVSVTNGRTVEKPANPSKTGFAFVGWYASSDFKTPYNFGTIITGDISVFGRFTAVDADANEYVATFYDGNGNVAFVKNTVGGKLFDVPELTVTGKTFKGWWISDYQSADKLTCKYEDETLKTDTNFYAVYAEDNALALNVKSNGIFWESAGVNKNYALTVKGPEGVAVATTLGSTRYSYDFTKATAGDYAVEVKVDGKTYKAFYKNKALVRVSGFKLADTFVVSFNPVEHAEKYYVTVECGNAEHVHTRVDNGTSTYYNFINCDMSPAGIKFVVEAEAAGYANSVSDAYVVNRTLENVSGLTVNETTDELTWSPVQNATGYTVEVVSAGSTQKNETVGKAGYSLKFFAAGTYTVKVTATAKGYNSSETATYTYNKKHIATPGGLKVAGKTVTFNAVEGAKGYVVKVGKVTKNVAAAAGVITFELTDDCFANGNGVYGVSVMAKGEKEENNSAYSDEIAIIIGDDDVTTASVTYEKGKVIWTSVANAKSYKVILNGRLVSTVPATELECAIAFTSSGENTIEVLYLNARGDEKALATTTVTSYTLSFNANGGSPVSTQYLATGDDLVLPESKYAGHEFVGWYNAFQAGAKYVDGTFTDEADVTLYAIWKAKQYTLSLDYQLEGKEIETDTVAFGSRYTLAVPEQEMHPDKTRRFGGWYSMPNGEGTRYTNELGQSYKIWDYDEQNRKLYAAWYVAFEFYEIDNGTAYSVAGGLDIDYFSYITIPETYNGKPVKIVEGSAFQSCSNLVEVNIPDTIEDISTGTAFSSCDSLLNVNIYETQNNLKGNYYSLDGVLFFRNEYNGLEIKYFPVGRLGEYVIPDGIETLPVSVFRSSKISKITIPASVTAINSQAFYSSRNLTEVVFKRVPEGEETKPLVVSSQAFRYCTLLSEITFPSRLTEFTGDIFLNCTALVKVNVDGNGGTYTSKEGVLCNSDGTEIVYCPVGRTGKFVIPSGISSIGEGAFKGCTKITAVEIPGFVTEIKKQAFMTCNSLKKLDFKGVENDPALTIGEQAFYSCTSLNSLTLPENLAALGANAFGNISALTEVTVNCAGDALAFENAAFGTTSETPKFYLRTLNIGEKFGVVDINGVFGNTLSVVNVDEKNQNYSVVDGVIFDKEVTRLVYYPTVKTGDYVMPDSVVYIGANVFAHKYLSKVTIGGNIAEIGENAFIGCENLTEVVFVESDTELKIYANAFKGTSIKSLTLPERTVMIGEGAFMNCTKLTKANVPAKVTKLEVDVFNGCTALSSVTIGEGVTALDDMSFANCTSLTEITLPKSITALGSDDANGINVFYNTPALARINVSSESPKYAVDKGVVYIKNSEGKLATLLYSPSANVIEGSFVVPADVKLIANGAFAYNNGITKLEFAGEASAFSFGEKVFDGCTSITEIELPRGIKVIKQGLFENCISLESIVIPNSVTKIEYDAFRNCKALSSVTFEEGGTEGLEIADGIKIGSGLKTEFQGVFVGCLSLHELALPERTTKIGSYAFSCTDSVMLGLISTKADEKQTGIVTLNVPSTVKSIGEYAFQYSNYLKHVNFAEDSQLESVGKYAFYYCYVLEEMHLPATVKTIGQNAFSYSSRLHTITFGEGSQLSAIEKSTFSGCMSLEEIKIPATVTKIDNQAFMNCRKLSSVTFENGSKLTSFGTNVFQYTNIKEFEFPETTATLKAGKNMFNNCQRLESLYISAKVSNISDALINVTALKEITVSANHTSLKMQDNLLTSLDGKNIYYALRDTTTGTYRIPEGTETISSYAFVGKTNITKVIIPASVRTIGAYAFMDCTSLEEVEFAEGVQITKLDNCVFQNCTSLKSFTVPASVTSTGTGVFSGCSSLTSVNLGTKLKTLAKQFFKDCASLETVELPASVTTLGDYVFSGCTKLKSVDIKGKLTAVGSYCFEYCLGLETFEFQDTVTKLGAMSIKNNGVVSGSGYIFRGCSNLRSVKLPSKIQGVPAYMFIDCTSLETIVFPETVVGLGYSSFQGCTSLNNIVIHENIKSLGSSLNAPTASCSVFKGCTSLSNITFEGPIGMIGKELFSGCSSLKNVSIKGYTVIGQNAFSGTAIERFNVENGTVWIYDSAFADCEKLTLVSIPASATKLGKRLFSGSPNVQVNLDGANEVYYTSEEANGAIIDRVDNKLVCVPGACEGELIVPEGLVIDNYAFEGANGLTKISLAALVIDTIPNYAFQNCTSLEEVVLPETIKTIGTQAFDGCISLKKVNLPEGLTEIKNYAFQNCTSLEEVVLPDTVETVGTFAWSGDTSLRKVTWSANAKVTTSDFAGCTSLETVILPEGVESIALNAFENCSSLASITLPSTLTDIGVKAFNGTALTSIVLPANLKTFGGGAFANCAGFTSITFAEVNDNFTTADNGMIYDKNNTLVYVPSTIGGEVVLAKGVKLGKYAFAFNTKITNVVLPDDLEEIPEGAFFGCTALTTLVVPDSVNTYGASMCEGCTALTSVTLGKGGNTLPKAAFKDCTALRELTIPENITTVNTATFEGCRMVVKVYYSSILNIPSTMKAVYTTEGVTCECIG